MLGMIKAILDNLDKYLSPCSLFVVIFHLCCVEGRLGGYHGRDVGPLPTLHPLSP